MEGVVVVAADAAGAGVLVGVGEEGAVELDGVEVACGEFADGADSTAARQL